MTGITACECRAAAQRSRAAALECCAAAQRSRAAALECCATTQSAAAASAMLVLVRGLALARHNASIGGLLSLIIALLLVIILGKNVGAIIATPGGNAAQYQPVPMNGPVNQMPAAQAPAAQPPAGQAPAQLPLGQQQHVNHAQHDAATRALAPSLGGLHVSRDSLDDENESLDEREEREWDPTPVVQPAPAQKEAKPDKFKKLKIPTIVQLE